MRIAVIGSGTRSRVLPAHLAALTDGSATVEIVHPRVAVFPATPYERLIVDVAYVDAAEQAWQAGCDAVVINSFADYGIEAARAAGIVMFGAGEAALRAAGEVGSRFSILTVWPPSMAHLYTERLRALGLESACMAVRHIGREAELAELGTDDNVMTRMQRRESDTFERILAACREAISDDGIQSIVLGCTCMAPIARQLAHELGFPVLEGSALAVLNARRSAESSDSGGRSGTLTSIGALVAGHGLQDRASIPAAEAGDCEACMP